MLEKFRGYKKIEDLLGFHPPDRIDWKNVIQKKGDLAKMA